MNNRILLLCDCQYDYIIGALSTSNAVWCMDQLSSEIFKTDRNYYKSIVIELDIHPINHCSFNKQPIHCIEHSFGAAIYNGVYNAILDYNKPIEYLKRGKRAFVEEDSFINSVDARIKFARVVRETKVEQIDIVGPDDSVYNLVQDFCDFNYEKLLNVLLNFCPSDTNHKDLKKFLDDRNIKYTE